MRADRSRAAALRPRRSDAAASGGTIYPYPFLDPRTDGLVSVLGYVIGLTAALVALGALAMLYSRWAGDRMLRRLLPGR